jgi:uncharacterized iron-regulated protein
MQIPDNLISYPSEPVHFFRGFGPCPGDAGGRPAKGLSARFAFGPGFLLLCLIFLFGPGCATAPTGLQIKGSPASYPPGTIIRTASGQAVSFEEMMSDLYTVPVVYVGEQHTRARHHAIQLKILKKLHGHQSASGPELMSELRPELRPELRIGMEMFDHTYQPVLDQWRKGRLTSDQFLKKTHWYANWKYDFDLYKDLLLYAKEKNIHLIGLNIPPHIPPKIAVGGIDNLLAGDRAHLPDTVDTSNEEHREYVRSVFEHHHQRGLTNFEYFYQAQCAWEDAMAEAIAQKSGAGPLLVLAGNGHLRHRYGIPERAYKRHPAPYRTILPMSGGRRVEAGIADYIWVSAPSGPPHPKMP